MAAVAFAKRDGGGELAVAEKPWAEMTADERRASRIEGWRNPEVEFATPEAEATTRPGWTVCWPRLSPVKPDRVPVSITSGWWPAARAGMTPYEAMHDAARAAQAWVDFNLEFQPDAMVSPLLYTTPASVFEVLDYKLYSWPGHGVAKESSYQYNEKEWMLPEEYDHLISDPSDYMLRTYLPRTVGAFAGFAGLSSFFDFVELPFVSGHVGGWGSPEMTDGLERLASASRDVGGWAQATFAKIGELMSLGFPAYYGGATKAPFDILGDSLRGTRGVVTDFVPPAGEGPGSMRAARAGGHRFRLQASRAAADSGGLHPASQGRGRLHERSAVPRVLLAESEGGSLGLIEEGTIPFLFAEGRYGSRLEAIMDLPKARTVWLFDQTDMARAKRLSAKWPASRATCPFPSSMPARPRRQSTIRAP